MDVKLEKKHLKHYPHFDQKLTLKNLNNLVNDQDLVTKNSFFPFIVDFKTHKPYRTGKRESKTKTRPIRSASRRDSAIFTAYRQKLSPLYEQQLVRHDLAGSILAYRKIPRLGNNNGGKCNIDFANDVFNDILQKGNCVAVALDISSFFEKIDHTRLYKAWCCLLEEKSLPKDHLAVFKAITKYSWVDRKPLYERLGFIEPVIYHHGDNGIRYTTPKKEMPKQLCSPQDFRLKVAGKSGKYSRLIKSNSDSYGIPQGAPISDMLANFYLLEFDKIAVKYANDLGGSYYRYSDDLLLVLPGDKATALDAEKFVINEIVNHGDQLSIKPSKTNIIAFQESDSRLDYQAVEGMAGSDTIKKNGFEYLGFRFDGKYVYLRDSTVSNFRRKLTAHVKRDVTAHIKRYRDKDNIWLHDNFNYSTLERRLGRVQEIEPYAVNDKRTFWSYVTSSQKILGSRGARISNQVQYRQWCQKLVWQELQKHKPISIAT